MELSAAEHRQAVEQIQHGIAGGSFYQVNLTSFLIGQEQDIHGRYAALATGQRGSFNALITTADHAFASASPELFLSRTDSTITTRPMKGTAARGRWPAEDRARVQALRASEKERAENVMIVDLMRNDLARIAEVGTVTVPALLQAERYPTVWQLTSTVSAQARTDIGVVELFEALFPPGSVIGAPKSAAMGAIAAVERRPRGIYCGAVGYLAPGSPTPPLRFAVAIRTLTTSLSSGYAEYGAGGGITWLSDPGDGWAELCVKTSVLCDPPARVGALLETLRYEPPARLANLDRHLDRLAGSAHHFAFEYDRGAVQDAVHHAAAGLDQPAQVRIRLDDLGAVVVATETFEPATAIVELAVAASGTVRSDDELIFHKVAARDRHERIRAAHAEAEDVVLVNENGHVTETTTENLAVCLDGRWWTPTLAGGLLPGVERARLLDAGTLTERIITTDDLDAADEIAVLSSLRGMRRARLTSIGSPTTSPTTCTSTTSREKPMPHNSCSGTE
ncbi:chorismate-binding protein [Pseudonocardia sp. GCM10023141]|uniref:chorismate-binding protein n=1 Tax=Pseudonocardia sp. GCM10023141 TaxID=3252653 RepID=UPI00360A6616